MRSIVRDSIRMVCSTHLILNHLTLASLVYFGKMTKAPLTSQSVRESDLLGPVHTDVSGPMSSVARGGFQYFITFTNDFSRYGYIYLMRHKSELFEKLKEIQNEVQNQLGRTIKFL
jgi:hypothetical protein